MRFSDTLIGAAAIAGGAALVFAAGQLRAMPGQQFGSAFFPQVIGICGVVIGIALIVQSVRAGHLRPLVQAPDWSGIGPVLRVAAIAASVLAFIQFGDQAGFLLSALIIQLLLMRMLGARWLVAVLASLAAATVVYLVFGRLLRVPLPYGVLERLLS